MVPTVATIVTAVLFVSGCASIRKSVTAREETRAESRDSTVRELRLKTAEAVPKSEVSLTLITDSLLDLPAGASYHAKSGRANLDVRGGSAPGTIVVHASCDSLQRLVDYYERQSGEYKAILERQTEEVKEKKKPPGAWWKIPATLAAGLLAGTVITLKIKKRNGK